MKQLTSNEMTALHDVKKFSILAILGFLLGMVGLALGVSYLLTALSRGISSPQPLTSSLSYTYSILPISVPAIVIQIVSLVFLRSGYSHLKGTSERFDSPYTGINLYFIALILIFVGMVLIIGAALSTSVVMILGGFVMILVGGIMGLVGEVLGLVIGAFRLRDHFDKSAFGTAGIMYVVGIFIPLFSFVGAILVYRGTSSILNEKRNTQT
jgi:uncharacterized membrane protein